jgi:DNA-binding winged helix-turn-helix (wHTH) protein
VLVRFGPFALDPSQRLLTRNDERLHLTPKAFDLLVLLVSEAPRVLDKGELHKRLWTSTFVSDATLAGLIKELRRALDDRDRRTPIIRTVHRVGYAFCLELQRPSTGNARIGWHWLVLNGRRAALHDGKNVIGREPECDVLLEDDGVSRRHACIVIANGSAHLEDLGSKNGTSVRDERVTAPVVLHDGDRLAFGSHVAVYRSSGKGMSTQTSGAARPKISHGNR